MRSRAYTALHAWCKMLSGRDGVLLHFAIFFLTREALAKKRKEAALCCVT